MKRLNLIIAVAAASVLCTPNSTAACPEMIVPVDPGDSALKSKAWRSGLKHWRKGRYQRALRQMRKTETQLSAEAKRLFRPPTTDDVVPNTEIQRWLQTWVYTERPSVLITGHRFTFPSLVWWAFADSACRRGDQRLATYALDRLQELRRGGDVNQHRTLVLLHSGRFERARRLAAKLPPDGFLSPYIEGWLAAEAGEVLKARERFGTARAAAALASQREALNARVQHYKLTE